MVQLKLIARLPFERLHLVAVFSTIIDTSKASSEFRFEIKNNSNQDLVSHLWVIISECDSPVSHRKMLAFNILYRKCLNNLFCKVFQTRNLAHQMFMFKYNCISTVDFIHYRRCGRKWCYTILLLSFFPIIITKLPVFTQTAHFM